MNNIDMNLLQLTSAKCEMCDLCKGRIKPVFARGSHDASIVICGMCPGPEENKVGSPFVGTAGKILDKIIYSTFGSKDYGLFTGVYITNLVKCFVQPGLKLESDWMMKCFPYFIVQMQLLQPKVMITLGKDVANFLLNNDKKMGEMRGRVHDYMSAKLITTYHPSFIARTGGSNSKYFNNVVKDFEKALKFI